MAGHKWLAKRRQAYWQAEVSVKGEFETDAGRLLLAGRVDFVQRKPGATLLVEEVKTCLGDPDLGFGASDHWAQAKVYGYLLAAADNLADDTELDIQLTRLDLLHFEQHSEVQTLSVAALRAFTHEQIRCFVAWLALLTQQRDALLASAHGLAFPFPQYRPQQQALARHVYRCIRDRRHLLVEAPTGSGKTMSVIYPAVKALGESIVSQVLLLTTKGSSQPVALSGLQQLRAQGLQICALQLTAKAKLCPCLVAGESSDTCTRCLGFYDRLPAARQAALAAGWLDSASVLAIAEQHQVCPFELSLEMIPWCHWLIGDVNYWFDPAVRLSSFLQGTKPALLIDEVHNLPDRARGMLSTSLSSVELDAVALAFGDALGSALVRRLLRAAGKHLRALARPSTEHASAVANERVIERDLLAPLGDTLDKLLAAIDEARARPAQPQDLALQASNPGELLQPLRRFVLLLQLLGDAHAVLVRSLGKKQVQCELVCLHAGPFLAARLGDTHNQIGFSATLSPPDYYLDNLGLNALDDEQLHRVALPSFFPPENRAVLITDFIDTRWAAREHSLGAIYAVIERVTAGQPGNYLLFMPSYDYLEQLLQFAGAAAKHWQVQPRNASDSERADFLAALVDSRESKLGVAVLGGVFAEAIDLPASALRGVMIVGSGMGQPDLASKCLQQYWADRGRDGFDYSFRTPGFSRVLQAAGRVVRSEQDRGVVVLLDQRFTQPVYRRWFPGHWQPQVATSVDGLTQLLQAFWR